MEKLTLAIFLIMLSACSDSTIRFHAGQTVNVVDHAGAVDLCSGTVKNIAAATNSFANTMYDVEYHCQVTGRFGRQMFFADELSK